MLKRMIVHLKDNRTFRRTGTACLMVCICSMLLCGCSPNDTATAVSAGPAVEEELSCSEEEMSDSETVSAGALSDDQADDTDNGKDEADTADENDPEDQTAESGKNSGTGTGAECDHNWVTHEASGHYETVIVEDAYDETVEETTSYTLTEKEIVACNACGISMDGWTEEQLTAHMKEEMLSGSSYSGYHSEIYMSGYCYFCGGKVVFRQCDFSGYSPVCAASEAFVKTDYDQSNGVRFMYRSSCSCGKNGIYVDSATGKGLILQTTTVHHDAVTQEVWVEDTASYTECSICGKRK